MNSLKEKFASTASWSEGEQSGVAVATEDIIKKLALLNEDYYTKHGFIFIVCATGKTAGEMLEILEGRLPNSTEMEILQAAEEQRKITHLRINKLFHESDNDAYIGYLDRPAEAVCCVCFKSQREIVGKP